MIPNEYSIETLFCANYDLIYQSCALVSITYFCEPSNPRNYILLDRRRGTVQKTWFTNIPGRSHWIYDQLIVRKSKAVQ